MSIYKQAEDRHLTSWKQLFSFFASIQKHSGHFSLNRTINQWLKEFCWLTRLQNDILNVIVCIKAALFYLCQICLQLRYIKLTHVGFRANVKISSRIVSYGKLAFAGFWAHACKTVFHVVSCLVLSCRVATCRRRQRAGVGRRRRAVRGSWSRGGRSTRRRAPLVAQRREGPRQRWRSVDEAAPPTRPTSTACAATIHHQHRRRFYKSGINSGNYCEDHCSGG